MSRELVIALRDNLHALPPIPVPDHYVIDSDEQWLYTPNGRVAVIEVLAVSLREKSSDGQAA